LDGTRFVNGTWVISILPHLERNDLWSIWHDADPMEGAVRIVRPRVSLGVTKCPSFSPVFEGAGIPNLHYVVNTGRLDASTGIPGDTKANGVFHNHQDYGTSSTPPVAADSSVAEANRTYVSLDYMSSNDGSSNTLLLGENLNAETLVAGSSASTTDFGGYVPISSDNRRLIVEADVGMVWQAVSPPECSKINKCIEGLASGVWTDRIRPASRHGTVVVMSFGDGHQQMVSESIDYGIYRHIMTPNSKKAGLTGVFDRSSL